jgi:hypothetical protein
MAGNFLLASGGPRGDPGVCCGQQKLLGWEVIFFYCWGRGLETPLGGFFVELICFIFGQL